MAGKVLSEYETVLKGKVVAEEWGEQLSEAWWNVPGAVAGCLGWRELVCVRVQKAGEGGWRVQVYGKKGSQLVTGLMEFLTFYLMQ